MANVGEWQEVLGDFFLLPAELGAGASTHSSAALAQRLPTVTRRYTRGANDGGCGCWVVCRRDDAVPALGLGARHCRRRLPHRPHRHAHPFHKRSAARFFFLFRLRISYMFRAGTVAAAKAVLSTQSDFRGVTTGVSSNSAQDASGRAVVVPNSQVRIHRRI